MIGMILAIKVGAWLSWAAIGGFLLGLVRWLFASNGWKKVKRLWTEAREALDKLREAVELISESAKDGWTEKEIEEAQLAVSIAMDEVKDVFEISISIWGGIDNRTYLKGKNKLEKAKIVTDKIKKQHANT